MNDDFIIRYRGAFSKEDCNEIIQKIEYFDENSYMFHDKSKLHKEDHKTINLNNLLYCDTVDLPAVSQISRSILPKFQPCVDDYLERFSLLKSRHFLVYDCKLKKIPAGSGFHSWHYENGSLCLSQRVFVIQLYLNDNFEGGETEFLYQNRREKPVAGDVLLFPCGFTHVHRGNPPIGGTKYLVTSWGWIQDDGEGYE